MKRHAFFIILFLFSYFMDAQTIWSVKSDDGFMMAKNYIGFDESRDSTIIETPSHKFSFSYHYMRDSNEITNKVDQAITVNDIKKIGKDVYFILATGGNLPMDVQLNLIFIRKNQIIKHVIIYSIDRSLDGITFDFKDRRIKSFEYYFDKKNNEIIIPRRIISKNDQIPIFDLDNQKNVLNKVMPPSYSFEII